ncbi:MAG: ArnT family glycosyltransferase, partial [Anaerolineales bacterium]
MTTDISTSRATKYSPATRHRVHIQQSTLTVFILVFLLGLALLLRLTDLKDPPLAFNPTRQLRSAIIARGIYYTSLPGANPETRRIAVAHQRSMVTYEPPILETIVAAVYRLMGGEYVWVARVINSVFWLIGGIALFDLARRMTSDWGALVGVGFYLILPLSVFASRSFQPEPGMTMWIILAIYALYRWGENPSWEWALLAGITAGIGALTKIVAAFFIGPAAIAVVLGQAASGRQQVASSKWQVGKWQVGKWQVGKWQVGKW